MKKIEKIIQYVNVESRIIVEIQAYDVKDQPVFIFSNPIGIGKSEQAVKINKLLDHKKSNFKMEKEIPIVGDNEMHTYVRVSKPKGKTITIDDFSAFLDAFSPEMMSKNIECKMLTVLRNSHTYFAEEFTADDVHAMITNILNDFPILLNTDIDGRVSTLDKKVKDLTGEVDAHINKNCILTQRAELAEGMVTSRDITIQRLLEKLIQIDERNCTTESYDIFSIREIVSCKLQKGYFLTDRERSYLLETINESNTNL